MLILRYLFQQISRALDSRDKRLQHLPFSSPETILAIIAAYLLFVLKWGPKFMEHRKPFNIDRFLLFYNAIQVLANLGIFLFSLYQINIVYDGKVNFTCEPLDFTDSWPGRQSAIMAYCYYLVKLLDLFDTIFFVLRKKAQQISFLHVYHHVAILLGAYIAVQWAPGGHAWIFGLLNLFVHVIMYGYYFGSIYYPELKNNLFIKKSITQMQIIQFMLIICHLSLPFIFGGCDYPRPLLILAISQNFIMLMLFSDFYYSAYIKPKRSKTAKKSLSHFLIDQQQQQQRKLN